LTTVKNSNVSKCENQVMWSFLSWKKAVHNMIQMKYMEHSSYKK